MSTDPAFGSTPDTTQFASFPDPFGGFSGDVNAELGANNTESQIAGQLGQAGELTAGIAQSEIGSQEEGYLTNLAGSALNSQYAQNQAGYQTGQLQLKGSQIGLEQQGVTQQQQEEGVLEPIQTSNLIGSEAAAGALNTKGSTQAQAANTAQQTYTDEELANSQAQLGIMAEANGMSINEVQNQLNYALAQSGLSDQMSAVELLNSIGQTNAGEITGLEDTISPAMLAAGLNAYSGSSISGSGPLINSPYDPISGTEFSG